MGQIVLKAETGELIEAFSVSDTEWRELCTGSKGSILMPRSNWPAVPKTSIRGLRFFAHHPGYPGSLPKPESYAHTRLKIDIVKAARSLGYQADIEVVGNSPEGEQWIADTLITQNNGHRTVFEVQLSSQDLRDFRLRTERYRRSSVDCVWIASEKPVATRLAKALVNDHIDYKRAYGQCQSQEEALILFGVLLPNKDEYPDEAPSLRFAVGKQIRRMSLSEAIDGTLKGSPRWRQPEWCWEDIQPASD